MFSLLKKEVKVLLQNYYLKLTFIRYNVQIYLNLYYSIKNLIYLYAD